MDNVNSTASAETIKDFIGSLSVEVITCFQVKSRRRPGETEDDVRDKKAFRVCIFTDELGRLLNADAWPESVSICTCNMHTIVRCVYDWAILRIILTITLCLSDHRKAKG